MPEQKPHALVSLERIENAIHTIRGERVILDEVLASLYGVTPKRLNEQVKRNIARFPSDFMFRLSNDEYEILKSQFATSRSGWGGKRKLPSAFTEHGAVMAASIVNTPKAVEMSIFVVRAFIRLRQVLASHRGLADKLAELEKKLDTHDHQIGAIFEALRQLMLPPEKPRKEIGFKVKEKAAVFGNQRRKLIDE